MKKYLVTIHYENEVEAENENDAINAVFEDLDSQSNMSLTNTLCQYHTKATPVAAQYDRVSQKEPSKEDIEDRMIQEGFCPHCDVKLVPKMFDIDGTNLEEHFVCPECGYGSPALQ